MDIPTPVQDGWTLLHQHWPWLDQPFHLHGLFSLSGRDPLCRVGMKVTARARAGAPKLFDWELYTLRVSWDAVRPVILDAMDIDEVDEEALKYKLLHTNHRLQPQTGFPGRTVCEVLEAAIVPLEVQQAFNRIIEECSEAYNEVLALSPLEWALAVEWNNQRLLFTILLPTAADIEDRYCLYRITPPKAPDDVDVRNFNEQEYLDWLKHMAGAPFWTIKLHPALQFYDARTWDGGEVWRRMAMHVLCYKSTDDPAALVDDDAMDETEHIQNGVLYMRSQDDREDDMD